MGFLVTMLIILIAGLVIIIVITQFTKKAGMEGAVDACRFSVMAQTASTIKVKNVVSVGSPLDIQCDTRYVTFKNTEVDAGLDPDSKQPMKVFYNNQQVTKFANLNDYVVNQVLAEEMRVCFYQFGQGAVRIWSNQESMFKKNACFICSDVTFDMKDKEYTGLLDFLDKTTIKSEGVTYQKYFDNAASNSFYSWSEIVKYNPDTYAKTYSNKHYLILFLKHYGVPNLLQLSPGDPFNGFENNYYVHIIYAEDIPKWCDMIAS